VEIIKNKPLYLCERISGIGFDKADAVARSVGISKNSDDRIAAGVKYVLTYNAMENGHVYLPLHKLVPTADKLLGCGEEKILKVIKNRAETGFFVIEYIDKSKCVYTSEYYKKEKYIADKLMRMQDVSHIVEVSDLDALIEKTEIENNIRYATHQRRAIAGAIGQRRLSVDGRPRNGTKQTVVRAINPHI
jgi:exodeoxyribonuclease V alpha subunit